MAYKKEDSEFPIAKNLREQIFKIPLLPQEQLGGRFAEIDALLYPMAIKLAEEIPSIRDYFQEIVHKVASGNTLGKNYFNKFDNEDIKPLIIEEEFVTEEVEGSGKKKAKKTKTKRVILKASEIRILSDSFALLRHGNAPKKFVKILEEAGFMRGVMEEAVELFFDHLKVYEDLRDNLIEAEREQSLEYLRFEQEMLSLLHELGLDYDDQPLLERLIPELEGKWSEYLDLREKLVSPYFRKVYKIAASHSHSGSQTLDNFQNGLLGLLRAYKCYTPSRFAAFSLVAEQWIKQSILLHIKTEVNFIKLPIANWHAHGKLEKIKSKIEQRTNREASAEEIAVEAKLPLDKVKKVYENVKLAKVLSLNVPTSNEEDQNEGPNWSMESVTDTKTAEDNLEAQAEYRIVEKVVSDFDSEETVIFALISGCLDLIDNTAISPADIELERIRQLGAQVGIGIIFK